AMISLERLQEFKFNSTELSSILTEEHFDFPRASRWMDEHAGLAVQAIIVYLIGIFAIKIWMRNRQPFDLRLPLALWNFIIANLSGLCALAMAYEYLSALYFHGFNETLCGFQDELYRGRIGNAVFVLLLARLPEFVDTFFIVLRKQKLMFIHWYHHSATLFVGWLTYSAAVPGEIHLIFVNSIIHTFMYSYFYVTALGLKPYPFIAKTITGVQITQFFGALYGLGYIAYSNYFLNKSCNVDMETFAIHGALIFSYTYLFVDFFITKYLESKPIDEHIKKSQ
ncbi:hypothetical protein PMAYCL1PPCAC_16753, partial [Pristionchus mayeri]